MTKNYSSLASLLLAGCVLLAGCSNSNNNDDDDDPIQGVRGDVTSTLGPLLDEYVSLTFTKVGVGSMKTVETDADGHYSARLTPGTYDLVALRPGYIEFALAGIIVAVDVFTQVDPAIEPMPANEYIGSANCGVCHEATHDTFSRTAHPFKINQIVNGEMPTYPFSSIAGALAMIDDDDTDPADPGPGTDNTLSTPGSYFDVSYVIGGYGWKARFMDADGFIVTGSEVQYNIANTSISNYHDNEVDKPFNCGNCHTTGWQHTDPVLNPVGQGGLPGIDGTFAQTGIQCESCHSAGSTHAQTLLAADITALATPRTTTQLQQPDAGYGLAVACGECHTRDGEKDYPTYMSSFDVARIAAGQPTLPIGGRVAASGGLIRHHEQYDEILGVDPEDPLLDSTRGPAFMAVHGDCMSCHSTHTTTVYEDISGDAPGIHTDCLTCHPTKEILPPSGMTGLACIDCHMPLMAKSAIKSFDPPPGDDRPALGDVASHLFSIDLSKDPATEQFTASGSFAFPYITGEWACRSCHSDSGPSFDITFPSGITIH